jgi:hypothetical protein
MDTLLHSLEDVMLSSCQQHPKKNMALMHFLPEPLWYFWGKAALGFELRASRFWQVLYCLSPSSGPFCSVIFETGPLFMPF